ncbi:MAG: hypothetical protein CMF26_05620 [Kiloniella sp.]|nr:hypothetical protein [Kiloniella sp.]
MAGSALCGLIGTAGADPVDVTLGASLDIGWDYGVGKAHPNLGGFGILGLSSYQTLTAEFGLAGTTDAGLRFGVEVSLTTGKVLQLEPYGTTAFARKYIYNLRNASAEQSLRGALYAMSGGAAISVGEVLSVKINSQWQSMKGSATAYSGQIGALNVHNICKLAGNYADSMNGRQATGFGTALPPGAAAVAPVFRTLVGNGRAIGTRILVDGGAVFGQPMLPGQFKAHRQIWATGSTLLTHTVPAPAGGPIGARVSVNPTQTAGVFRPGTAAAVFQTGFSSIRFTPNEVGVGAFPKLLASTVASKSATVLFSPGINELVGEKVNRAQVYLGPFMDLRMTSSTTKMAHGAVCLSQQLQQSATQIHMELASRLPQFSNAAIFVEGGFGRLTVQRLSYEGGNAVIGDSGDSAGIGIDGDNAGFGIGNGGSLRTAVAMLEGTNLLGLTGHAAVDVSTIKLGGRPNYLLGASVDLSGLSVVVEFEDDVDPDPTAVNDEDGYIDHWDASLAWDWEGIRATIATDDDGDWAIALGYEWRGFTADTLIENVAPGQSQKAGLSIDTILATQINGLAMELALDENFAWDISAHYSLGGSGFEIYASYMADQGGGRIGSKLSF